jgi:sugar phosphate isomerase/epimerase
MKLGHSTGIFRWKYSLEESIRKIGEAGYDGVEIWADRPHGWPRDYPKDRRKQLLELIKSSGLEVPSLCPIFFDLNFASLNPAVRKLTVDQVNEATEMASELGSKLVLVVPGKLFVPGIPPRESVWNFMVGGLRECASFAEDLDITLAIENLPETYLITTSAEMMKVINDVNSENVQAYLDVANINPLESPVDAVKRLRGHIASIHFSDNDGKIDAHMIPGQGTIDFKSVVRALKDAGYDGYLISEVFHEDPDFAVAQTREFMRPLI